MSELTYERVRAQHTAIPSILDRFTPPSLSPNHALRRRNGVLWSSLIVAPVVAGLVVGRRSRRGGIVAGGLAALALGGLRWQLARWFSDSPSYQVEGRLGQLELRAYSRRIDAVTRISELHDLDAALDRGFGRLACYHYGANSRDEDLAMTTPITIAMRDGAYVIALAMPRQRSLGSLPAPDDPRIELREVPARRIAALQFRGRFTRDRVESHERRLLRQLIDAGLSARGSVAFACYDSPATLPMLRRNELWIELV